TQNIIISFISLFLSQTIRKINYKLQNESIKNRILVNDLFFGHEAIQSKNISDIFMKKFNDAFKQNQKVGDQNQIHTNDLSLIYKFVSQALFYAVSYYCLILITDKELTTGDLMFFFTLNSFVSQFAEVVISLIRETVEVNS